MIDEAAGPAPTPNRRRSWRGQLEDWARADARHLAAHPWVLDVRLGSPPTGPNLLGWMDIGFQILHRSGLAPQEAASSLLVVDGYVRNHVLLGLQYASAASGVWVAQLRSVLDPDELPAVSAMLESGAFDDDDGAEFPGDEFEFGLALLLDGIEQLANRRAK
jgi:hypothetical protein